jgi:hypothetical protein
MNPHTAAELPFRIILLDQLFRHFGDVGRQRNHIQSVEFEVVQRPRPWRTFLSLAVVRRNSGLGAARRKTEYVLPTQIRSE